MRVEHGTCLGRSDESVRVRWAFVPTHILANRGRETNNELRLGSRYRPQEPRSRWSKIVQSSSRVPLLGRVIQTKRAIGTCLYVGKAHSRLIVRGCRVLVDKSVTAKVDTSLLVTVGRVARHRAAAADNDAVGLIRADGVARRPIGEPQSNTKETNNSTMQHREQMRSRSSPLLFLARSVEARTTGRADSTALSAIVWIAG